MTDDAAPQTQLGDFVLRTSSVGTGMFASCYLHQASTWQPISRPNKGVVHFSFWLCATYAVTTKRGSQKPIRPAQRQQLMQRTWPERAMTSDGSAQHRMSRYWWLRNTGVSRYDWRRAIPGNERLSSHTARLISVIIMKAKAVNTEKISICFQSTDTVFQSPAFPRAKTLQERALAECKADEHMAHVCASAQLTTYIIYTSNYIYYRICIKILISSDYTENRALSSFLEDNAT